MSKISHNELYNTVVPYHSFMKQDNLKINPEEIIDLYFDLLPTSYLIKKGHKIRIAIGGADKDHFEIISEKKQNFYTIYRSNIYPSYIELPIIK